MKGIKKEKLWKNPDIRIVEHMISIYLEMVRCMLHSAKMDLQYWGEAFSMPSTSIVVAIQ